MRNVMILFFCCAFYLTRAADPKYPVSAIPEELKKGMYAVIREQSTTFEIYDINKSSLTFRSVITILNSKGNKSALMGVGYDKFRTIEYFKGVAYDAAGNVIKKLKQSEIVDRSSVSGFSLFEDDRIKMADLSQMTYPYTVEFEFQVQMNFLYSIPGFWLYTDDEITTQKAVYKVVYPKLYQPRFRTFKIGDPSKKIEADGREAVTWGFENVVPVKFEKDGPDVHEIIPHILAAPDQFEYGGYRGNMSSWEEYGKWNLLLNKGRDQLPETTKQKVRELTKNLTTTEQKSKALYEYLQSKTRYVSIQLGIGGLQPFEASLVDQVGYGDCKALSNYMVAMLREVGVKGYYTTIMAGPDEPRTILDFPSHQSSHVIVGVPNGVDTLWLECTNQTAPFGYQGTFTGGRKALMITENGGKIVNTIHYRAEQNTQSRTADVFVEKTGNAKAIVKTTYSGLQYENGGLNFRLGSQYDDQKKWVQNNTDIPSFDLNSFSITNKRDKIPSATVNLDMILNRYAATSGKRLFLTPNLMNRSTFIPEKVENRKTNVVLKGFDSIDRDTVRFHLPEEIYPEYLPEPIKIKSRFGEYESSFKIDQGSVLYIRKMVSRKGEFPASSYQELIEFYKSISKADNIKLVFLNKT